MRRPDGHPSLSIRLLSRLAALLVGVAFASASASASLPFPEPGSIDPVELDPEVHRLIAEAATSILLRLGAEDPFAAEDADDEDADEDDDEDEEAPEPLWVHAPQSNRRVVGREPVERRYRRVTTEREVPVYEWTTRQETVRVRRGGGTTGDPVTMETVTRDVRVRGKQIGTRTQTRTRLVRDPEGPIRREETRRVYGPGGPDDWHFHLLGHNARALHALRVAGVDADDPQADALAQRLRNHVRVYGPPEGTYDLAWLTAAFARMPGDDNADLTRRLAGRLLVGQLTDGPAAGLWASAAISPPVILAMLQHEMELSRELATARSRGGDSPSRAQQARINQAENALRHHQEQIPWVSRQGFVLNNPTRSRTIEPDAYYDFGDGVDYGPISRDGPMVHIHHLVVGDLAQTAWALYALREARQTGRLPERVPMPTRADNQPLRPADPVPARILAAARAVVARQLRDGSWNAGVFVHRVTGFEDFSRQSPPDLPADIEDPFSVLTTATGWFALRQAVALLSPAETRGFMRNLAHGEQRLVAELEAWRNDGLGGRPVGGRDEPYDLLAMLAGMVAAPGMPLEVNRSVWETLVAGLARAIPAVDEWPSGHLSIREEGVWAFYEARARERFRNENPDEPLEGRDWTQFRRRDMPSRVTHRVRREVRGAALVPMLMDGARRPLAGQWALVPEPSRLSSVADVVAYVDREYAFPGRFVRFGPEIDPQRLRGLSALFVAAEGDPRPVPDDTWVAMGDYLMSDGLLVVEYADTDRGRMWKDAFTGLLTEKSGRTFTAGELGDDHPVWASFSRPSRKVAQLQNLRGGSSVLFVPVHPGTGGPPAFSVDEAREFAFRMIQLRTDTRYWDADYALGGATREDDAP